MRIFVDRGVCEASGQCTFALPAVFRLDDEGWLHYDEEVDDALREQVEQAVALCPTQAIEIED